MKQTLGLRGVFFSLDEIQAIERKKEEIQRKIEELEKKLKKKEDGKQQQHEQVLSSFHCFVPSSCNFKAKDSRKQKGGGISGILLTHFKLLLKAFFTSKAFSLFLSPCSFPVSRTMPS